MYISHLHVRNYKSFTESSPLELTRGFNIVTGANNAGKTALLQAASVTFTGSPHRSLKTVPRPTSSIDLATTINLSIVIEPTDIRDLFARPGQYFLPFPKLKTPFAQSLGIDAFVNATAAILANWFTSLSTSLRCELQLTQVDGNGSWAVRRIPSFGIYECEVLSNTDQYQFAVCSVGNNGSINYSIGIAPRSSDIGTQLGRYFALTTYRFNAERFHIGTCPGGNNHILAPDASNLAEALNILQANPHRFTAFNKYVSELFPGVHAVSVKPDATDGAKKTIRVWNIDPVSEREDLTIPLNDSGTGLGQVLAILYVILTSDTPRTIIIDEPQSFLHPGAVRKLMQILKDFSGTHQFIIATHSPAVIVAAESPKVFHLSLLDGESKIKVLARHDASHLHELLAEIGATFGDVFGADNILWVEGITEELCFPKILSTVGTLHKSLMGTIIKGLITTGDFTRKERPELIWQIYQKLSNATGLVPSALGFLFDDEGRSEQEKKELQQMSEGLIGFTKRRMFENYLLDVEAITEVINASDGALSAALKAENVANWLDSKVRKLSDAESTAEAWEHRVDAAKLLKLLFSELTDARVSYQKTKHSVALTEWLLEHRPEALRGLATEIEKVLEDGKRYTSSHTKSTTV